MYCVYTCKTSTGLDTPVCIHPPPPPHTHTQYSLHITLVDQCLKLYREGINEVCKVEQNLATGTDPQGEPITDPMKDMMPCLFNRKIRYSIGS